MNSDDQIRACVVVYFAVRGESNNGLDFVLGSELGIPCGIGIGDKKLPRDVRTVASKMHRDQV
jgi:hypothetical protein